MIDKEYTVSDIPDLEARAFESSYDEVQVFESDKFQSEGWTGVLIS